MRIPKLLVYFTLLLLGGGLLAPLVSYATLTLDSTTLSSDSSLTLKSASSSVTVIGETNQTGAITIASSSQALTLNLGTGTAAATVNIATSASLLHVINLGAASTTISVPASTTFGGSVGLAGLTNSILQVNSSGVISVFASSTAGKVLTATSTSPYFSWETASTGTTIPAGTIVLYASSTAPSGWLIADGSAVSRTTYAALFAAIGTTYGAGDGSTTFNIPDFLARVPVGLNANGPNEVNALADNEGVTANSRNISHRHTSGWYQNAIQNGQDGGPGSAAGTGTGGNTSGDTNNLNKPAYLVINYIIKT